MSFWDSGSSSYWGTSAPGWGGTSAAASGAKGMFDPVTMGIAAGTSLVQGILQGQQQNNMLAVQAQLANQQLQEQRRNQFQNMISARDAQYGGQRYGYELDKSAKEYGTRFLGPLEDWRTAQFALRGASTSLDPLMRKASQNEYKKQLDRSLAEKTAQIDQMFGAPADKQFGYGKMPSYVFSA